MKFVQTEETKEQAEDTDCIESNPPIPTPDSEPLAQDKDKKKKICEKVEPKLHVFEYYPPQWPETPVGSPGT